MKRPLTLLIALAALIAAVVFLFPSEDSDDGPTTLPDDSPPPVEQEAAPQIAELDAETESLREFAGSFGADTSLTGEVGRQIVPDGEAVVRAINAAEETVAPAWFLVRGSSDRIEWIEAKEGELRLESLQSVRSIAAYAGGSWSNPVALDHEIARHDSLDLRVDQPAVSMTVQVELSGIGSVSDGICLPSWQEQRPTESFEDIFNPAEEVEEVSAFIDQSGRGQDNSLFWDAFRFSDPKDPRTQSESGQFEFNDLPAGHYRLRCSSREGVETTEWVTLAPGEHQVVRIELVHGGFIAGQMFGPDPQLPPEGRIAATPLDATFAEFVGERRILQTLEMASVDGRRVAAPDVAGNYRIGPLAPGKHLVMGLAEGLRPGRAGEVEVLAGREVRAPDLHLVAGHAIAILVRNGETGEVLTEAEVFWRNAGENVFSSLDTWQGTEETDEAGRHVLRNLPFQPIEIEARAEGFAALRQEYLMPESNWVPGTELSVMEFPLETGRSVYGQVFGPQGQLIPGAHVSVAPAEDQGSLGGVLGMLSGDAPNMNADEEGRFRFDYLPSGNYIVYAQDSTHAPGQSEPVDLTQVEEVETTVRLASAGSLLVRYLDEDGQPGAGQLVIVTHLKNLRPAQQVTNEQGEASFGRLAAGNYNVQTIDSGASQGFAEGNFEMGLKYFELLAGEEKVLEIGPGLATAKLAGIMRADGVAAAGISVTLLGGGIIKSARTEEDGSYSFDGLLPQIYTVLIGGGQAASFATEVLVETGDNRFDHELPDGGLEVRVVKQSDGTPVAGTPVTVTSEDSLGNPIFVMTDSEGIASFRFLNPGPYHISVGTAAMPIFGGDASLGSKMVDVTVGSSKERVEVMLEEGSTFRVRALDLDGNPLAGVSMFYLHENGTPLGSLSMTPTNSKGVAQLAGLPSGPGRILLKHPLVGQKEFSVTLTPGELSKKEVQLEAGVTVVLKVIDASGGPATGVLATLRDDRGARISMLYSMQDAQQVNQAFFAGLEQRLGPVAPGRYTVEIFRLGGKMVREELVVPANSPEFHRTMVYKP